MYSYSQYIRHDQAFDIYFNESRLLSDSYNSHYLNRVLYSKEVINEKAVQEKKNDSTDDIHQHETTTTVPIHKLESRLEGNKMLCLADTILQSRYMDNFKITVVHT